MGEGLGDYAAEVAAWDAERDRRLRNPNGWLALVGLHWLTDGAQTFGADSANPIQLVGHGVPLRGGTLDLTDGRVTLHPEPKAGIRIDDTELDGELVLVDDIGQPPTVVDLGALRFHVIRRGDRIGLRVRDTELPALQSFAGVPRFPVERILARHGPPRATAGPPDGGRPRRPG